MRFVADAARPFLSPSWRSRARAYSARRARGRPPLMPTRRLPRRSRRSSPPAGRPLRRTPPIRP
ncbi:hypothetical protein BURPSS13_X0883 [Burkholderia pseudomallei S13]|nr:hypothetical protein BURPSS13_X0883 [Burkholderia pseudomallei S13]